MKQIPAVKTTMGLSSSKTNGNASPGDIDKIEIIVKKNDAYVVSGFIEYKKHELGVMFEDKTAAGLAEVKQVFPWLVVQESRWAQETCARHGLLRDSEAGQWALLSLKAIHTARKNDVWLAAKGYFRGYRLLTDGADVRIDLDSLPLPATHELNTLRQSMVDDFGIPSSAAPGLIDYRGIRRYYCNYPDTHGLLGSDERL